MLEVELEAVAGALENFVVVGVLVFVPEEESLHARAGERVLQFVRAVSGVDVDERRAGAGATHVHHDPLNAVGGPQADAIAAANAEGPEATGDAIGYLAEFGPGHAARLVARSYGKAVRKARRGAMEEVADGEVEEGDIFSVGVAEGFRVFVDGHAATHCDF